MVMLLRHYGTIFILFFYDISIALSSYNDDDQYYQYQDQDQEYHFQDYANDDHNSQNNLYHKYAEREENKKQGFGGGLMIAATLGSYILGSQISKSRSTKALKIRHQKEQKALYSQYYNDVYKLTDSNRELQHLVEKLKAELKDTKDKADLDALQRDYEEFKQPDIDGDDRISRAEFNMYVKNYLSNYPGLQEKDYPKFEDFDHDGDGYVGFKEYAQQMALQVQQMEQESYLASGGESKTDALQSLMSKEKKSTKGESFEDLYSRQYF